MSNAGRYAAQNKLALTNKRTGGELEGTNQQRATNGGAASSHAGERGRAQPNRNEVQTMLQEGKNETAKNQIWQRNQRGAR